MKRKLFCELCPLTYQLSLQKMILVRSIRNLSVRKQFAKTVRSEKLPVLVSAFSNHMIKKGPGIDPELQLNKVENIRIAGSRINGLVINTGETFSFWERVGKTSVKNGFREGRVIVNGRLVSGLGGGLCNLANTLHLLALHSPLTVTEMHHHSDALAPDPDGVRVPYSAGTSVNYNFIDLRFRNDTQQPLQLCVWCEGDELRTELRTTEELPYSYRLTEEDHHFHQEDDGKFYRVSKIYRETIDRKTGNLIRKELNWDNHSEVLFDYSLIPEELIR